jgi:hypothetical protein
MASGVMKVAMFMLNQQKSFTADTLALALGVDKKKAHQWFWLMKSTTNKYEIEFTESPLSIRVLSITSKKQATPEDVPLCAESKERKAQRLANDFIFKKIGV